VWGFSRVITDWCCSGFLWLVFAALLGHLTLPSAIFAMGGDGHECALFVSTFGTKKKG